MLGINKIIIMGTVGRLPDTRYIAQGVSYSHFSVCTDDVVTLPDGRQTEESEWHEVVAWRQLSDYVSRFVKKGDAVYVSGKLKSRYVSKGEGGHRIYEIIADEVKIIARSKVNVDVPAPAMQQPDANVVGSALPGFDIENIPVNLNSDELPF